MKNFKKKLIIIAVVVLIGLLVAAVFPFILPWSYSNTDANFTNTTPDFDITSLFLQYNFGDGENTYTDLSVLGTRGFALKSYKVANMYFGLPVTSIAPGAFANNTTLESITLPENLKYISENSFDGCTSLKTVSLPSSLVTVSDTAFNNCTSLQYNEYENALYLGNDSNPYVALMKVIDPEVSSFTIHSGAVVIADFAFAECKNIETITFEGGIPMYTYNELPLLQSVSVLGDATTVPGGAFRECSALKEVVLPDTIQTIENNAFASCNMLKSINMPKSLVTIGNSAFSKCKLLSNVELPETVTSIGNSAFAGCSYLTSINLPDSITSIGESAFAQCTGIKEIHIPASLTEIKNYSFMGCMSIKSIEIPEGVTSIGMSAFDSCVSLANVKFPQSLKNIGSTAFTMCSALAEINLPDSVTHIGDYAFSDCTSVERVSISQYVEKIGAGPFYGCEKLVSIDVDENNPNYKSIDGNLYSKDEKTFIQYAMGKENVPFYIPDTVTIIGDSAFRGCRSLKNVIIPASVENVQAFAFFACSFDMNIYCEIQGEPSNWDKSWNYSKLEVYWGYDENN